MMRLILASGSPRRRELMALAGIPCAVIVSDAEEIITEKEPSGIVTELSAQKAAAVADTLGDAWVIGADTIVCIDGVVLGKPKDRTDAARMLRMLSGRAHSVFTGVTILVQEGGVRSAVHFYRETVVHVAPLSEEEIAWYLDTGDPFDKAGSYGIQGPFAVYVEGIEGDYQTVVGLPVSALYQELKKLGWKRPQKNE